MANVVDKCNVKREDLEKETNNKIIRILIITMKKIGNFRWQPKKRSSTKNRKFSHRAVSTFLLPTRWHVGMKVVDPPCLLFLQLTVDHFLVKFVDRRTDKRSVFDPRTF
jgi:hypothetical protein